MKQTKAPKLTPSPRRVNQSSAVATESNPSAVFVSMALDMSWRLAIVVLVPIIAGALIDKHYKNYLYLIIGLVLALIGAILVIYRSYLEANKLTTKKQESKA